MKKNIKYVLIDTNDKPSYEDYLDFCAANSFEPKGEDSEDYWDYVHETQSMWYNDEMDNIKFSKENDTPVIVIGTLGLWDGRHDIYPVLCDSLHDAIEKCVGRCDNVRVEFNNGIIEVDGYHHDGTNSFSIMKLSAEGMGKYDMLKRLSETDFELNKRWTKKFKMI